MVALPLSSFLFYSSSRPCITIGARGYFSPSYSPTVLPLMKMRPNFVQNKFFPHDFMSGNKAISFFFISFA